MDTFDKLERSVHELVAEYADIRGDVMRTAETGAGTLHELKEARETIGALQRTIQELKKEINRNGEIETRKIQIKEQVQKILDKVNAITTIEKVTNA